MSTCLKICCCCCTETSEIEPLLTSDQRSPNNELKRGPSPQTSVKKNTDKAKLQSSKSQKLISAPEIPLEIQSSGIPVSGGVDTESTQGEISMSKNIIKADKEMAWEHDLLYDVVLSTGSVKYAAIVSYPHGTVRIANFAVDQKGIKDVIAALQGKTQAIAEGIHLSANLPLYIAGKLDNGTAIYATELPSKESQQQISGGCIVIKTRECILITVYKDNVSAAERLTSEVADRIRELGH